jgi:hypothetical protein
MGTHSVADAKTKLPRLIDRALGGAMTSAWPNLPPFFEKSVGGGVSKAHSAGDRCSAFERLVSDRTAGPFSPDDVPTTLTR